MWAASKYWPVYHRISLCPFPLNLQQPDIPWRYRGPWTALTGADLFEREDEGRTLIPNPPLLLKGQEKKLSWAQEKMGKMYWFLFSSLFLTIQIAIHLNSSWPGFFCPRWYPVSDLPVLYLDPWTLSSYFLPLSSWGEGKWGEHVGECLDAGQGLSTTHLHSDYTISILSRINYSWA